MLVQAVGALGPSFWASNSALAHDQKAQAAMNSVVELIRRPERHGSSPE
ncbi:hypothetical protein [Polaromonas sp. CG9_12]|nr:hypothetical protein [Polaromonas sp. CG9_12]